MHVRTLELLHRLGLADRAVASLAERASLGEEELRAVLYRLEDEAAGIHLFRVAAGLDSMVPGEGGSPKLGGSRRSILRCRGRCRDRWERRSSANRLQEHRER